MTIETIELAMKSMNADAFHRLGDHFLFYDGGEDYESIDPVGQAEGKQKPRRGTPDTKIKLANGKYIFIQYTTQENVPKKKDFYNKLVADLKACFDPTKTKIPAQKLERIVLCFNSNLDEATERKLEKITAEHRVPLKLVNLTTMAHAIYKHYHYLAKDYLGLEIGSFQLLPLEKFVKEYDRTGIPTPISNPFFYRQAESNSIKSLIAGNMITVVKGPAGVGKSRLAVEVIRQFSKEHKDFSCYCITNKDLSVINDLRSHFSDQCNVLIFIDDANKSISLLRELLTWYAESDVQLKVILTVREYVYKDISTFIERFKPAVLTLGDLSEYELTHIIASPPFHITDPVYQQKIIELAKGNARLAVMAALASVDKPIETLDKVTDIYEEYYKRVSGDNHFLQNHDYLKVLGLLAFFRTIDRDNIEETERIFKAFSVDPQDFWTKIYQLEEYEIVQVFSDRSIVKFTDQILEGYLFYKVFLAEKLLSYQVILDSFYPRYSGRIKFTAIEGKSTFGKSDFEHKLLPYITRKYNDLLTNNGYLFDFLQLFYAYLPDETLAYLHTRINLMPVEPDLILLNKVSGQNNHQRLFLFENDKTLNTYEHDPLFELLTEFLQEYSGNFDIAIELLFDYIEVKQELAEKLITFITGYYNFSDKDERAGFQKEYDFSKELIKRLNAGRSIFKYIFLRLAPHFLRTNFFYHINYRGAAVGKASYQLFETIKNIRTLYWTTFNDIYKDYLLLSQYTLEYIKNSLIQNDEPVLRAFDWAQLEMIFDSHFNTDIFFDAYLINKIIDDLSGRTEDRAVYRRYLELADTEKYRWFQVLDLDLLRRREREQREGETWQDFNKRFMVLKTKELVSTFNYPEAAEYLPVFDVLGDCATHRIWSFFREQNAAQILLNDLIENRPQVFAALFKAIVQKPYFQGIIRYEVLFRAVQKAGDSLLETIEAIIFDNEFINFQYVRVGFFNSLEREHITEERCRRYKELLASLTGSFHLSLNNVATYAELDPEFLRDLLPVMLARAEDKNKLEFRLDEDFIEKNYSHFDSIDIAKNIYLYLFGFAGSYDYEGSELLFVLNRDAAFLGELMAVIVKDLRFEREDYHQLSILWELPDYITAITTVFDALITNAIYLFRGENVLEHLIKENGNKGDEQKKLNFFRHYLTANIQEEKKLNAIFKLIRNKLHPHFDDLLETFLTINDDLNLFKKIRWTDQGVIIRSGDSIRGEIDERIWRQVKSVIEKLTPKTRFLAHKLFVNQQIDHCRKDAVSERKMDFLRYR